MFDIITLGKYELIIEVLNAVAMLFDSSGPAGTGRLIMLGFLIGVLLVTAKAIVTQRLELQWLLVAWLIYAALFVPKVTVTVEDAYTGATTTVANVPLGIGAIGGITSQIGATLTEDFGAVFTLPSLTQEGYLDTLNVLMGMRRVGFGAANDGSFAAVSTDVDFQRTLRSYLVDCLYTDIHSATPTVTLEELRTSDDLLTTIAVNKPAWFTTTYLPGDPKEGTVRDCAQAYNGIKQFAENTFWPEWNLHIEELFDLAVDAEDRIQNALDTMVGVGKDAQQFMLNALFQAELRMAELGYHSSAGDTAGTLMRVQAMEQRRTQWATEQSMFLAVARPIMAYIEAFFYAISPFMVFLLTLGSWGVSMLSKYLILAVWIQLWHPMMAINQLYITMSARDDIQALESSGNDIQSMAGMDQMWTTAADWIATGGMMAAVTPMLALMVITGSYYAMTQIARRFSGGDFVNEKIASPDLLQPAPAAVGGAGLVQSPDGLRDPQKGHIGTGADQVLPALNFGAGRSHMIESARNLEQGARRNWQHTIGGAVQSSTSDQFSAMVKRMGGESFGSSGSHVDNVGRNLAEGVMKQAGITVKGNETLRNSLALGLTAGLKGNGLTAGLSKELRLSQEQSDALLQSYNHAASQSDQTAAQIGRAFRKDVEQGTTSTVARATQVTDDESYQRARTSMEKASDTYKEADALQTRMGADLSMASSTFGNQVLKQDGLGDLTKLAAKHGVLDAAQDRAGWLRKTNLVHDPRQALATAIGERLVNKATAGGDQGVDAAKDLARFATRFGIGDYSANQGDPGRNEDIAPQARQDRGLNEEVEDNTSGVMDQNGDPVSSQLVRGALNGNINDKTEAAVEYVSGMDQKVNQFHDLVKQGNVNEAKQVFDKIRKETNEQQAQKIAQDYFASQDQSLSGTLTSYWQNRDWSGVLGREANIALKLNQERSAIKQEVMDQNPGMPVKEAVQIAHERTQSSEQALRQEYAETAYQRAAGQGVNDDLARYFGLVNSGQQDSPKAIELRDALQSKGGEPVVGLLEKAAYAERAQQPFLLQNAQILHDNWKQQDEERQRQGQWPPGTIVIEGGPPTGEDYIRYGLPEKDQEPPENDPK